MYAAAAVEKLYTFIPLLQNTPASPTTSPVVKYNDEDTIALKAARFVMVCK